MKAASERSILLVIWLVQFVNVLDFVIVMPLGPDFAQALHFSKSSVGTISSAYAIAAALSGLVASQFLDRFDRRTALTLALSGLATGTALGALAHSFWGLVAARFVAGLFGGPATSLSFSIVADTVPPERRGRALGIVMSSFSLATSIAVPIGVRLALGGRWWLPLVAVAALGLIVTQLSHALLPPMRAHIPVQLAPMHAHIRKDTWRIAGGFDLLARRPVQLSYGMTALVMMAGFLLIPNISAFTQANFGFPRANLHYLYFAGGLASFISLFFVGRLVDRLGAFAVGTPGVLVLACINMVWFFFDHHWSQIGVYVLYVSFMATMPFRNVPYNTLTSRVPRPEERARFLSIQSSIMHIASASGALISSRLLAVGPFGELLGMKPVAALSIGLSLLLPLFFRAVQKEVSAKPESGG